MSSQGRNQLAGIMLAVLAGVFVGVELGSWQLGLACVTALFSLSYFMDSAAERIVSKLKDR